MFISIDANWEWIDVIKKCLVPIFWEVKADQSKPFSWSLWLYTTRDWRERLSKYWTHYRELHRGCIGRREGRKWGAKVPKNLFKWTNLWPNDPIIVDCLHTSIGKLLHQWDNPRGRNVHGTKWERFMGQKLVVLNNCGA